MKENIGDLMQQVEDKQACSLEMAKHIDGINGHSIYKNWFRKPFFHVPEAHEKFVVAFLQKWIANQNKVKA